jgi:hypothetical protein
MQEIISPIDRDLIERELNDSVFIRPTNNGRNKVFIIDCLNAPNTLKEIGRLREISFRQAGGGTGRAFDLDDFDLGARYYKQLIVWSPNEREIVGGYRYQLVKNALDEKGHYHLSTTEIYHFTERLKSAYFPYTIELGRSFVQPKFQPAIDNRKGIFSLDNLWDGLGALVVLHPDQKFFWGKVTMYRHFNVVARDHIMAFLHHYFPDREKLMTVEDPVLPQTNTDDFLSSIKDLDYKSGHQKLNAIVRGNGENIPPLLNSYMNISPTMKTFQTCINSHFGEVEETGILVTIADIYESKKDRHVNTYLQYLSEKAGS